MSKVTLVTGLWDIKRGTLTEGWNRSYQDHYIPKFRELLKAPCNLIIFGESDLKEEVFKFREESNTQFIEKTPDWFKNEFFNKIQEIRSKPEWFNQATWLKESTQASLEMYNPLVMSKMFLLNDARILSKFNTDLLFWIDAGLTNTVHPGYFTHDKVLDKLQNIVKKFTFIAFPYNAEKEIHGFTYPDINEFAEDDVKLVCRGGFFGGPSEYIQNVNTLYYNILQETLDRGYMGTEESLFSILLYKYPELLTYSAIESNGLISKFFEDLKLDKVELKSASTRKLKEVDLNKVGVYVITYNSPNQFKTLCESFEKYDSDYLTLPKKFLLNNSIDRSTDKEYSELCEKYNFTEIKKDNIGICGGRQYIAEHFEKQKDLEYYLFFEDDMFFYVGSDDTCKNGFIRKIKDLYKKSLEIISRENIDFLKLNFTEFFGDNQRQWSWHNVPQHIREKHFPENPIKVSSDHNKAPFLKFSNIKSHKGVPYALGEVYYCNWPQIVSRKGNKKMFLDTTWQYPYEQTWMSHMFQLTVKGELKPGILLATPTEHNRFEFYPKDDRREN